MSAKLIYISDSGKLFRKLFDYNYVQSDSRSVGPAIKTNNCLFFIAILLFSVIVQILLMYIGGYDSQVPERKPVSFICIWKSEQMRSLRRT